MMTAVLALYTRVVLPVLRELPSLLVDAVLFPSTVFGLVLMCYTDRKVRAVSPIYPKHEFLSMKVFDYWSTPLGRFAIMSYAMVWVHAADDLGYLWYFQETGNVKDATAAWGRWCGAYLPQKA